MKVCFVVNAVGETSVPADIARALVTHTDTNVDILAWFEAGEFRGSEAVPVTTLDAPGTALGINRSTYRDASRFLRSYDLVQTHHNHSGSFAKLIAARHGIPSVSREGNLREGFSRKGRVFNGTTNALAAAVVCNSRSVAESMLRWERLLVNDEDIHIIENGVDIEKLGQAQARAGSFDSVTSVDPEATLVANAANFTRQKAHVVLVRAISRASDQLETPIELALAGEGPLREQTEQIATALGIENQVHFLGLVDRKEVYELLGQADIYAMPSRWEGFSAAALEAVASGTACVFSDIDPFVYPYEDVALFHPVDDAPRLGDRLVELAENDTLRAELGSRGRKLARENYAMSSIAARYRELYEWILSK